MARHDFRGPAFFGGGFRPFFLGAGISALLFIPIWIRSVLTGNAAPGTWGGLNWHVHEMTFGYLGAAVGGFLLTAIPNWTGRLPVDGIRLACLFALWLAGRIAMFWPSGDPTLIVIADLLFPVTLAGLVWREILAGRNWRNLAVCALVTLYAGANLLFDIELLNAGGPRYGERFGLAIVVLLVSLIGGRIIPSFTTNWLIKMRRTERPAAFARFDRLVLALTGIALAGWVIAPERQAVGAALLLCGAFHFVRLVRWRGWTTASEPLVLILHAGYLWLPVGLVLIGLSGFAPGVTPASGIHALAAGALVTMTIAVMMRATLGHTGRQLVATRLCNIAYASVVLAAVFRVAAALAPARTEGLLVASGSFWTIGFLAFLFHFGPMLFRRRVAS